MASASSSACSRHQLPPAQLLGTLERLLRLDELGLRLLNFRRSLHRRQLVGVGRAVAGQRAREGRFLLIQVVLRLFTIELEQDLPCLDAIAKVRPKPLTRPSASAEIVTSSSAASVPTTSMARRICSSRTCSTFTGIAASLPGRAWAFGAFEQAVRVRQARATSAAGCQSASDPRSIRNRKRYEGTSPYSLGCRPRRGPGRRSFAR